MKTIKIENTYDLGDRFSNVTFEGAWKYLVSYLEKNKNLLSKLSLFKDNNSIVIQSLDENALIDVIKEVDSSSYFQKILSKNIKLNLKFNKETKELELDNSLNDQYDDINTVNYNISYEFNQKNDVYFSEDSLLINYENISDEDFNNFEYRIGILFFSKSKIIKNENDEIISEIKTDEYMLILYNKNTNKLKFMNFNVLNKENEMFNLSTFISKYNNNESIEPNIFDVENNEETYKFSDLKIAKTLIAVSEPTEDAIILFKNSLNHYIFDNFIKLEKERNSKAVE